MNNKKMQIAVLKNGHGMLVMFGTVASVVGFGMANARAHGFVGDRFFPPTIATDDPFAMDELLLPSVSYFKSPAGDGSPTVGTMDVGFGFDKEIFPKFALGISGNYLYQKPDGEPSSSGFDNFTLSANISFGKMTRMKPFFPSAANGKLAAAAANKSARIPRIRSRRRFISAKASAICPIR